MRRTDRARLAEETVRILEAGAYELPGAGRVSIAHDLASCLSQTRHFTPEELPDPGVAPPVAPAVRCRIEVENETTLEGIRRLLRDDPAPVAALNFASARHPGGGFRSGAQAQEESLARSSGLYASLLAAPGFYERHRSEPSLLYTDALILSPGCPVFRDDTGALLPEVHRATFISGAAPNAGALHDQRSPDEAQIPQVLRRRIGHVLALAAREGHRQLVLGAWGCGVFRNDPRMVASSFRELLRAEGWEQHFSRVLFAVLDLSADGATFRAFRSALGAA